MAIDPAARAGTARHFIVADYVLAVYGDLILLAAPRRKPRRRMIHTPGKPLRVVYETRVLDADAVRVGVHQPACQAMSSLRTHCATLPSLLTT